MDMNLQKLFTMQAKLDADITAKHPVQDGENRLEKKVLALLVELGECANEWRGFKFWSNNQEPRVTETCRACDGKGYKRRFNMHDGERRKVKCSKCDGTGTIGNPLLEEYVDCLHFILSIGNDLGITRFENDAWESPFDEGVLVAFNELFLRVTVLYARRLDENYYNAFESLLILGKQLGFTWDQIEQAYYDKNKINFERQENGY